MKPPHCRRDQRGPRLARVSVYPIGYLLPMRLLVVLLVLALAMVAFVALRPGRVKGGRYKSVDRNRPMTEWAAEHVAELPDPDPSSRIVERDATEVVPEMCDIRKDIENKADELKDTSADQHFGDAMDDADPESEGTNEMSEAEKKRRLA